jgi:hypothetical protein
MSMKARVEKLMAAERERAWEAYVMAAADILEWIRDNNTPQENQAYYRVLTDIGHFPKDDPETITACGGAVELQPGDHETANIVDARVPAEMSARLARADKVLMPIWKVTK